MPAWDEIAPTEQLACKLPTRCTSDPWRLARAVGPTTLRLPLHGDHVGEHSQAPGIIFVVVAHDPLWQAAAQALVGRVALDRRLHFHSRDIRPKKADIPDLGIDMRVFGPPVAADVSDAGEFGGISKRLPESDAILPPPGFDAVQSRLPHCRFVLLPTHWSRSLVIHDVGTGGGVECGYPAKMGPSSSDVRHHYLQ